MENLPDYNATPEQLLTFIAELQKKYDTDNLNDLIIYNDLNVWRAIVGNNGSRGKQFRFNEGDRQRLFEWLQRLG